MLKRSRSGAATITAHELARRLLQGPDVPVFHDDPSLIDVEQEDVDGIDRSVSRPIVEFRPEDDRWPAHVLISGDNEQLLEDEEEALFLMRDVKSVFDWLEEQLARGEVRLIRQGQQTAVVMGKNIFVGEDLMGALLDGEGEEHRGGIRR